MPAYNTEKYIQNSIESILNQSYINFELIIIDDGSIDQTLNIINSFKDKRIHFYQNKTNIGIIESLNKAIDVANGEYIARMDADDIAHIDRLKLQFHEFKKNEALILCGSWYKVLYNKSIIKKVKLPTNSNEIKARLLFNNQICHPSVMIKSNHLKKFKYNIKHIGCEDFGLWNVLKDKGDFVNIPLPLLTYRLHNTNISLQKNSKKDSAIYDIISENIFKKYKYRIHTNFFTKNDIYKIFDLMKLNEYHNYERSEFLSLLSSKNILIKHFSLFFVKGLFNKFFNTKICNLYYKIKIILIERNIFYSQ